MEAVVEVEATLTAPHILQWTKRIRRLAWTCGRRWCGIGASRYQCSCRQNCPLTSVGDLFACFGARRASTSWLARDVRRFPGSGNLQGTKFAMLASSSAGVRRH
jgi:hypothetical protein